MPMLRYEVDGIVVTEFGGHLVEVIDDIPPVSTDDE